MTINHITLTSSQVHEPKHITTAPTSDAGKVITVSSSTAGTSVWRKLAESELTGKLSTLTVRIPDLNSTTPEYTASPYTGTIVSIYSVVNSALSAATVITTKIGASGAAGSAITNGTISIAGSGAAGDVDGNNPTANNTIVPGQYLSAESDGAAASGVATVTFVIQRDN